MKNLLDKKIIGAFLAGVFAVLLLALVIPAFLGTRSKSGGVDEYSLMESKEARLDVSAPGAARGSMATMQSAPAPGGGMAEAAEPVQYQRMLVKTGNLSLRVGELVGGMSEAGRIAKGLGGEVFQSQTASYGHAETGSMTLRVPAEKFEPAMEALKKSALRVLEENVSTEDVTETFIDTDTRLRNMVAEEGAYVRLLGEARRMEDIISLRQALGQLRGQIESLQGRLNHLKRQAAMSTINVQFTVASAPDIKGWDLRGIVRAAYTSMVEGLKGFVEFTVRVVFMLPVLLMYLAPLALLVYLYIRYARRNKA